MDQSRPVNDADEVFSQSKTAIRRKIIYGLQAHTDGPFQTVDAVMTTTGDDEGGIPKADLANTPIVVFYTRVFLVRIRLRSAPQKKLLFSCRQQNSLIQIFKMQTVDSLLHNIVVRHNVRYQVCLFIFRHHRYRTLHRTRELPLR
jgi:hypothetical protein